MATNEDVQWELAIIAVVVVTMSICYIVMKMSVLNDIPTNGNSIPLINGTQSMTLIQPYNSQNVDQRTLIIYTGNDTSLNDKGGFTISMWIGLSGLQNLFANNKTGKVRIPLFIKGIPKIWYASGMYNNPDGSVLIKSPVIYLVIEENMTPYFEIEFNHIVDSSSTLIDPTNYNSCAIMDKFTALCAFFKNSQYIDLKNDLQTGNYTNATSLHHVAFVFSETYVNTSFQAIRQELYTKVEVFIDGDVSQTNFFKGQMKVSSNYVMVLPATLCEITRDGVTQNVNSDTVLSTFLTSSTIADVVFYCYPLTQSNINQIITNGYNTTPSTAIVANAPTNAPAGTYLVTTSATSMQ